MVGEKISAHYLCRNCDRQFVDIYDQRGYSQEVKKHCLTLYCNGLGFRAQKAKLSVAPSDALDATHRANAQQVFAIIQGSTGSNKLRLKFQMRTMRYQKQLN